jgi:stage IV sporulation protein FA
MDYERAQIKKRRTNKKEVKKVKNKSFIYINQLLITSLLTIITLIVLKSNIKLKEIFYEQVYEKNISFAQINNWYQNKFGSPIPFSNLLEEKTETVFSENLTYSSKEQYEEGVKLVVNANYLVPSLETGMVIFVGEKENYGNTVIVEQVNGVEVWYSNITSSVQIYDYIEKGTLIGEADGLLYLVFKKDGNILNYEDYI